MREREGMAFFGNFRRQRIGGEGRGRTGKRKFARTTKEEKGGSEWFFPSIHLFLSFSHFFLWRSWNAKSCQKGLMISGNMQFIVHTHFAS